MRKKTEGSKGPVDHLAVDLYMPILGKRLVGGDWPLQPRPAFLPHVQASRGVISFVPGSSCLENELLYMHAHGGVL